MGVGEWIAWLLVLLLSLYGCAQLIRRICLWMTRCDRLVCFYQLAVPSSLNSLEPLMRCLQSQNAWRVGSGRHTLVLLPELTEEESRIAERLLCEDPSVIPMTEREFNTWIGLLRET